MKWSKFPQSEPEQSGYYMTRYLDVIQNKRFYKRIYWREDLRKWMSWRPPHFEHVFTVECFKLNSRTDLYV
ncbi:hypothetical protein b3_0233 [Synechococcus phage B3]|nr:hypothetical protein b3_0233 [Synechococcus phage B3]QGT54842.1 hypothetical protein b23_0227 [Synechococcus phage B23]